MNFKNNFSVIVNFFFWEYNYKFIIVIIFLLIFYFFILMGVSFLTLFERHLLGRRQLRVGPNKNRFLGIVQAIFDGLKLFKKEFFYSLYSYGVFYIFIPILLFYYLFLK